jgi:hypothetical protein
MSRLITTLTLVGIALTPLGCYASAGAYTDADYVEADYVPPRVEVYPSYVYGGRTVYLVDGRWYYRRGPNWVYYRREPVELYRRRVYVQQAPRAPDRRVQGQREFDRYRDDRRREIDRRREQEQREVDRRREERSDGHRHY